MIRILTPCCSWNFIGEYPSPIRAERLDIGVVILPFGGLLKRALSSLCFREKAEGKAFICRPKYTKKGMDGYILFSIFVAVTRTLFETIFLRFDFPSTHKSQF
jgi:hypothetical protein